MLHTRKAPDKSVSCCVMPCPHLLPQPRRGALLTAWVRRAGASLELAALLPWVCPASSFGLLQTWTGGCWHSSSQQPLPGCRRYRNQGDRIWRQLFLAHLSKQSKSNVDETSLVPFTPHQLSSLLPDPWPLGKHLPLPPQIRPHARGPLPALLPPSC